MSTNYPTGLDSYTTRNPGDTIASATIDNLQDAVAALQAKAGINGSAVTSSLDYKTTTNVYLTGSGVPSGGTGANGNLYMDTATGIVYLKTAGTWASIYTPSGGGATGGTTDQYGFQLVGGIGTLPSRRTLSNFGNIGSGTLYLNYFRAPSSLTVNTVRYGLTSAATGTTLSRFGIYAVTSSTGALTSLLASCANDTTIFTGSASASAYRTKALSAGLALTQDTWYCLATLWTGSGSSPQVWTNTLQSPSGAVMLSPPVLAAAVGGQTDLPASVASGSLISIGGVSNIQVYAELMT